MSINFNDQASYSDFLRDATNTATLPTDGEAPGWRGANAQQMAAEIMALQYVIGLPGLREGVAPAWGNHTAVGIATSSLTSVVFTATQSSLVIGSMIAGAAPTSTGFRRVMANPAGPTVTVDRPFDTNLIAEQVYIHGTIAKNINTVISSVAYPPGHLNGFTLANGTDATNDIDVTAGTARDSSNAVNMVGSAMTKQIDASWAAGTNQGGLFTGTASNTTYYFFAIYKDADASIDYGFDTSSTAANKPAGYSYYVLLGVGGRRGGVNTPFILSGTEDLVLYGHAGYAATNTQAPRFSTAIENGGVATILFTYHDDSAAGANIEILLPCEITISYQTASSASGVGVFISKNPSNQNAMPSDAEMIACQSAIAVSLAGSRKFIKGDRIRIWHSNTNGISANTTFLSMLARKI